MMNSVLNYEEKNDTMTPVAEGEYVVLKREDLLQEHQALLARVQQLRRILKLNPLLTAKRADYSHR